MTVRELIIALQKACIGAEDAPIRFQWAPDVEYSASVDFDEGYVNIKVGE